MTNFNGGSYVTGVNDALIILKIASYLSSPVTNV